MENIIVNILEQYKELTSLSEGHYDHLIYGDKENLINIARQIIKEIDENFAKKIKYLKSLQV